MSDIDTIREAIEAHQPIRTALYNLCQEKQENRRFMDVVHAADELTRRAFAALDRLQAQQPNAEPVAKAIAMVDDFRWAHEHAMELATATHGPMPEGYDDDDEPDTPWHCFYDGAMTMFNDVRAKKPASTEPPSYVYSRDYEALYDLLMRGGEAIVIEQWPNGEQARRLNRRYLFGRSDAEPDTTKEFAINLWRRLDLEWIAPSTEPRLTVEQAMVVVHFKAEEWFDDNRDEWRWRVSSDGRHIAWQQNKEAAMSVADTLNAHLRDRLTKAAKLRNTYISAMFYESWQRGGQHVFRFESLKP